MHQWRHSIMLAIITLMFGSAVQAAEGTTLVPLGPDQEIQKTSVVLADRSEMGLSLHMATPFLELADREQDGEKFQMVSFPGEELDGAEGQPALPLITRLVALPDGQTLRVKSIQEQKTVLDGSFRPWPAQGLKDAGDQSLALDRPYYLGEKRATEPALVSVGQPGLLRGLRVVPVQFRPVRWNATDGQLAVSAEIDVSFEWVAAQDGNNSHRDSRPVPESFASLYQDEVIGYQRDGEVMSGPGSYLLIYPENSTVRANLEPLISWRQRQGYNVVVASTLQTGSTTTSIKNYIQSQYDNLSIPLEFVTLVGDADGLISLPTFHENLSGYNGEGDHEYTLLEGGDVLADVHIGRLSVTSTSMLAAVVGKIVNYESDPYLASDAGWFTRAGLTGDPSASGYSCIWINQWVKHQLLDLNYTQIDTIWGGNFATLMSQNINQGESIFTYRGYYGMSGMHTGYIDALNNGEKLPFALILTCDTGSFQSDNSCRSEAFFRNPNGGAVAAMGTATTGTHTRYNNCMFQGVAEGVLNSGDSRVGPGLTRGKLHLYENYYDNEPSRVTIWSTWNNLMGDPATAIWTAIPRALTVDYPTNLTAGTNVLPVTVRNGGLAQAGALVTVFRKDVLQVSAVTDASGQVYLPLSGLIDGEFQVTVTGRNLKPFLGGFNVGNLPASINFTSLVLDDDNNGDSQGNGDGVANPGEDLELTVSLTNNGTGGVNNVTAHLVSPDPRVTVAQADAAYGYLGSGATVSGQQDFVVQVSAETPGGSNIPLQLVATDGSATWNSLVPLVVSGPAAEVQSITLSSGTINPGQSSALQITLVNSGNLPTGGASAVLSSTSRWITVTDGAGAFGSMAVGGTANNILNTFTINAAAECYPGHVGNLDLTLTFAEGGSLTLPVLVTVGSAASDDPVGPDVYGYYGFDNTDAGYEFAPTYQWVEIAPDQGGQGTSVGLDDFDRWEDDVVVMDLPFEFTYYGSDFNKMSVCSNGWVSLGATNIRSYRNWALPSPGTPDNMIAVYWDDLHIRSSNSGVYWWHDTANHRLIIEWDNMANSVTGAGETFQVILWDPAYGAGDTGDGIITMNYQDVNATDAETGYATVGIQNEARDDAVLYTYYNMYPGGAAPLVDGRSITFRTVIPQEQGVIRGMVTNSLNGAGIDGANISVLGSGLSLFTTEDGSYLSNLTVGTYDLAVNHPSFAPDTTYGVVITEDMETVVDFSLTDIAGPLFEMQTLPESTGDTAGPYDVVYKLTDYSGIQESHFYYTSSSTGGPFELAPVAEGAPDTWRVSIPGQANGTLVQFWLTGVDQLDQTSTEPEGAPFNVHSFMVAQTTVIYDSGMENATDWSGGIAGDTASTGIWENVDPNGVFNGSTEISPEDDHSDPGTMCWVTGQDPVGGAQGSNDVDGGVTTLQSPSFDVGGYDGLEVQYYRWYTNDTGFSPGEDYWQVQALAQDGSWVNLENTNLSDRSWQQMHFVLADHLVVGNNLQFRFVASDEGGGSVVEAAVDDFTLTSFSLLSDSQAPQVSLLNPNGGEALNFGDVVDVTWNQSDDIGVVQVQVLWSTDGGANFDQTLASGALNGSFSWTVPTVAGSSNRIKVIVTDAVGNSSEAVSAGNFTISGSSAVGDLPAGQLLLAQNAPNPFNPRTEIKFSLPSRQDASLRIYNVEGRLVRTLLQGRQAAGTHTVQWSGLDDQGGQAASGLYFYRLITDNGTLTRKMTLLK